MFRRAVPPGATLPRRCAMNRSGAQSSSAANLQNILSGQRSAFADTAYLSALERRTNLKRLLAAILARRDELASSIDRDFGGRAPDEVLFSEISVAARSRSSSCMDGPAPKARRLALEIR